MVKKSQVIFMNGKEKALKALFSDDNCRFGYLAIGYVDENNGFEDSGTDDLQETGFQELDIASYSRIKLEVDSSSTDADTGKVLVKFIATLEPNNINETQPINQLAIVNQAERDNTKTDFYSATTFPTFIKTSDSSITFVIGFRL